MGNIKVNYDELVQDKCTALSWALRWDDIEEIIYFPKSQCTISEAEKAIEMPEWMYNKKLAEYD